MSDCERAASLRVLVVDDEPGTRALLTEILEAQGYDVRSAGSGADGLEKLREGSGADLLVLDISLPDMDGTDLALRAAQTYGPRPTIFVTGWVDEFFQMSEVPGRWVVLHKPVAIPKLLECVESLGVAARSGDQRA